MKPTTTRRILATTAAVLTAGTALIAGNTATAKGTFARKVLGITVDSKTLTVSLSCDKNGNLS